MLKTDNCRHSFYSERNNAEEQKHRQTNREQQKVEICLELLNTDEKGYKKKKKKINTHHTAITPNARQMNRDVRCY